MDIRDKRFDRSFFSAYVLTAIIKIVTGLSAFFMPIYLKSIGFSGLQIGIVFGAASLTGLLFVFWIGVSSDRYPIKKIIALGLVLTLTYYIGLVYITAFAIVLLLFILGGLGGNVSITALDSYALKKADGLKGKIMGIYGAMKSVGFAIGVIIGGYLLFFLRFNTVMLISGIATFVAFIFIFGMKNTATNDCPIGSYISDFKNKRVIMFSALLLVFTLHWGVENVAYSLFLKENLHLDYVMMGWFMAVPIFFLGISSVMMGKRFDRGFSAKGLLLMSFLMSGLGLFFMAISTNVFAALIFRIIHEIGDGAFSVFVFTGAASYFTKDRMGGNYGLIALITIVGTVLGSIIFSPIGSSYGYQWPNLICGAIIAISGFFIIMFRDDMDI